VRKGHSLITAWHWWQYRFFTRFLLTTSGQGGKLELFVVLGEGGSSGSSLTPPWLGKVHGD